MCFLSEENTTRRLNWTIERAAKSVGIGTWNEKKNDNEWNAERQSTDQNVKCYVDANEYTTAVSNHWKRTEKEVHCQFGGCIQLCQSIFCYNVTFALNVTSFGSILWTIVSKKQTYFDCLFIRHKINGFSQILCYSFVTISLQILQNTQILSLKWCNYRLCLLWVLIYIYFQLERYFNGKSTFCLRPV